MNRGSALKWVELLRDVEKYPLHHEWELKFDYRTVISDFQGIKYSPSGVLEEFIQQKLVRQKPWSGIESPWHESADGSIMVISADTRKRIKSKTDLEEVDTFFKDNKNMTRDELINFITENYERF